MTTLEKISPNIGLNAEAHNSQNADILNKTWERSGIYYSEVQTNDSNKTSNNDKIRQALITEANSLGISFRDNIGNDKLQERINEFKNKN